MADPLVSIIVAVKNGERFLPQALADIAAQTYANHETVVVDGRSTDRSAEIARSAHRTRVVEQDGQGFADAWNIGLEAARGELIAILDSDDRWSPEKLAKQVELLRAEPQVDYVITHVEFLLEPGHPTPPGLRQELLEGSYVANMPSAMLARRSVFDVVGNFRTDYEVANDIDWFARVKDSPLTRAVIAEPLVVKRLHDSNLSYFSARKLNRELLDLLRESVARGRS